MTGEIKLRPKRGAPLGGGPQQAAAWEVMFQLLTQFKDEHGHCFVPARWRDNPTLAGWLGTQRTLLRKGRLQNARLLRLDAFGPWLKRPVKEKPPPPQSRRDRRFDQLTAFSQSHGHICITKKNEKPKGLSAWLSDQRLMHRRGTLNAADTARLESLGIEWVRQPNAAIQRLLRAHDPLADPVWVRRTAELRAFKEQHGHIRVISRPGASNGLAGWLVARRKLRREGKLPEACVHVLDEMGIHWNPRRGPVHSFAGPDGDASGWDARLAELAAFRDQHGHANVPSHYAANCGLGGWVSYIRAKKRRGRLSPEHIAQLETLGFLWRACGGPVDVLTWDRYYVQLRGFKEATGHANVPADYDAVCGLSSWVRMQRSNFRHHTLTESMVEQLDAIGFQWASPRPLNRKKSEKQESMWEGMFTQLQHYQEEHGHCNVPSKWKANPGLGAWVCCQRRNKVRGVLRPERQARLEAAGFTWNSDNPHRKQGWEARLAELAAFKQQHGHLRVTLKSQASPGLMHWRDNQRIAFREGKLTPERKARLDALGFEWECPGRIAVHKEEHNVTLWERMFSQLLLYREEHGHCQVPTDWKKNPVLAKWVHRQRGHHKHDRLPRERKERLEQIGFVWKSDGLHNVKAWDRRFADLVAFKQQHGHLGVTRKNQTSPGLMHWRDNQRIACREGKLPPERKARLDALGFEWQCPGRIAVSGEEHNNAAWDRMFAQLLAFREQHGHCQVPQGWAQAPILGKWVCIQRLREKQGTLRADRQTRLAGIGFAWTSDYLHNRHGWERRFAQLVAFQQQHGHLGVTLKNQTSPGLMHWRDNQRVNLRNGSLAPQRKARLDALGFDWQSPGRHPSKN